jgi:hypothetical protein
MGYSVCKVSIFLPPLLGLPEDARGVPTGVRVRAGMCESYQIIKNDIITYLQDILYHKKIQTSALMYKKKNKYRYQRLLFFQSFTTSCDFKNRTGLFVTQILIRPCISNTLTHQALLIHIVKNL